IEPVCKLEPLLLGGSVTIVRADVDVDKPSPVDSPGRIHPPETSKSLWELRRDREDGLQDRIVQPIPRPHHRVAQPVRRDRELHRYEGVVPPAEESKFGRVESGPRLEIAQDARMDDAGQEIVEDDELVVKA